MSILQIRKYGDLALRSKAKPVEKVTPEVRKLIKDMFETMRHAPGIGLAAPQVGVLRRIIVVDVEEAELEYPPIALINPEITDKAGEEIGDEGCLSLPNIRVEVKRPSQISVRGITHKGKEIEFEADGLFARAIQHEVDHLNGILIIDYLEDEARHEAEKQLLSF